MFLSNCPVQHLCQNMHWWLNNKQLSNPTPNFALRKYLYHLHCEMTMFFSKHCFINRSDISAMFVVYFYYFPHFIIVIPMPLTSFIVIVLSLFCSGYVRYNKSCSLTNNMMNTIFSNILYYHFVLWWRCVGILFIEVCNCISGFVLTFAQSKIWVGLLSHLLFS